MNPPLKIRILLVDDHILVRVGISGWLKKADDTDVVAEADNATQALTLYAQHRPDVVLMDRQLPDFDGITATRQLCETYPDVRVIMLSMDETEEAIFAAEQAGASGYLPKSLSRAMLLTAVRAVAAGGRYFEGEIGARLTARKERTSLSPRELEVLRMVAQGQANKEIADTLRLSLPTVKNHLAHILQKLDVPDRTRAVTLAMERGLLRVD